MKKVNNVDKKSPKYYNFNVRVEKHYASLLVL